MSISLEYPRATRPLPEELLPQLPGYKAKTSKDNVRRRQIFSVAQGQMFMSDAASEVDAPESPFESTSLVTESSTRLRARFPTNNFVAYANQTLQWAAYFEEEVVFSNLENARLRKCVIVYYLEDDTLSVAEMRQPNSGMAQGTILKRCRPIDPLGRQISIADIEVGGHVDLYGRRYFVVDASPYTRKYLQREFERIENDPLPLPSTEFDSHRRTQSRGVETGQAQDFRVKKNELKQYIEAKMGTYVDNSRRAGFLKHGHNCLMFVCSWDDTQSLYGDQQYFKMLYHLADDTVEVFSIRGGVNTNTRESEKLLKRCKLPRDSRQPEHGFYTWRDFAIGSTFNAYSRQLMLIDADGFTREFYEANHAPLADAITIVQDEPIHVLRQVPPYNGLGSEEDSLKSCVGPLGNKSPPKKRLGEDKVLSFHALLCSGRPEDAERRFVIQFFVIDNTVKIMEPAQHNSGFTGGCFLSRSRAKDDSTEFMTEKTFFVGARIRLVGNTFQIVDATESTLRYMEVRRDRFPQSDLPRVFAVAQCALLADAQSGRLRELFQVLDESGTGRVNREQFKTLVSSLGLQVTEQETLTLYRAFARRKEEVQYEKFIAGILSPTNDLN